MPTFDEVYERRRLALKNADKKHHERALLLAAVKDTLRVHAPMQIGNATGPAFCMAHEPLSVKTVPYPCSEAAYALGVLETW